MKYLCSACNWIGESDETPFHCPASGRLDKPVPPDFLSTISPDTIIIANEDNPVAAEMNTLLKLGV